MSRLLLLVALLACVISVTVAGDARSAARQLGRGVRLGQPLATSASGVATASLAFSPSTAELCPVVSYATSVEPLADSALLQLSSVSGLMGKYASDAKINAPAGARAYKVVIKPLSYMQNNTVPSVDWIDLHFRVGSGIQQSLQMKAVLAGAQSASSGHSATHSLVGASYEFGPIFLTKQDTLSFAFTICASLTDCNTEVHTFQEPDDQQAQPQQLQSEQQAVRRGDASQQQSQQQQSQQAQQPQQQPQQPDQQGQQGAQAQRPSVRRGGAPEQQAQQAQQPSQQQAQQPSQQQQQQQQPSQQQRAQQPSQQQQPQQLGRQQQQSQVGGCPAIAYTYKLDCGEAECKASFVNMSPDKPLDWVDVHVVRSDEGLMQRLLARSAAGPVLASALAEAAVDVQQNFQMSLAAGSAGLMHSSMSSQEHSLKFGAASEPNAVLQQSGGAQVFQMPIPMQFRHGDLVGMFFTYCQSGVDCDTEIAFFKLEDDGTGSSSSGSQTMQQQQMRLANVGRMEWSGLQMQRAQLSPSSAHALLHTDL